MVIDKSWTSLGKHEKAFYTGLKKFVDDCKPLVDSAGNIRCPCKSCRLVLWVSIKHLSDHISKYGFDPSYKTWIHHGEPDLPPPPLVIDNTRQPQISDMTACLNDLSYIPLNNEQNEPTQGDIGETSNDSTQAKRNEFKELYASANEELYPGSSTIYNGKKAAFKDRHLIPDSDGTYDLKRIRLSRPSHISKVNWDAQIAFWNDPKNHARAAQNKQNRAKSKVVSGVVKIKRNVLVELNWTKRSIFYELEYWSFHTLKHNLDVMHIEKNVLESILNTLLMNDKSKDTAKARQDLKSLGIRSGLWLGQNKNGKCSKPQAAYSFTPADRKKFCQFIKGVKLPDGFGSYFKHKSPILDTNITGLKSHDCHIMMQRLLPYDFRQYLPRDSKVIDILCNLELIYPPAFFDIMIHLVIHLPLEAIFGGPISPRWMYPFERYLERAKKIMYEIKLEPEVRLRGLFVAEEALTFSSHYFRDVTMKFNRPDRNVDCPPPTKVDMGMYSQRPESTSTVPSFKLNFLTKDMERKNSPAGLGKADPSTSRSNDPGGLSKAARYSLWTLLDHIRLQSQSNYCVVNRLCGLWTKTAEFVRLSDRKYCIHDVARGHGGDGGGDDRPPPYQVPTGCEGCLGNRGKGTRKPNLGGRRVGRPHTRQETRNLGLKAITDKSGPVPIRFEVNDRETLMCLSVDHAVIGPTTRGSSLGMLPLHYHSLAPIVRRERKAGIYNGKKAALKERYWVPEEDGTYDLERLRPADVPRTFLRWRPQLLESTRRLNQHLLLDTYCSWTGHGHSSPISKHALHDIARLKKRKKEAAHETSEHVHEGSSACARMLKPGDDEDNGEDEDDS
ncbi:hypothetical protein Tco_0571115 [Tanacetum coccineum]